MLKLRILIVEDDPLIRADLRRTFRSPPPVTLRAIYGDVEFEVETAATAKEARAKMANAIATHRSYDVVLFDLGLPRDAEHLDDCYDAHVGLEVLQELRQQAIDNPDRVAVEVIIVVSGHDEMLEELLRTQVVADFVGKPWGDSNEVPYRRVMDALKLHWSKQASEWATRKTSHTQWLSVHLQNASLRQSQFVTTGVSSVERELRQLQRRVEETCNVSFAFDRQHPLVVQWEKTRDAVIKIATDVTEAILPTNGAFIATETPADAPTTVKQIIEGVLGNVHSVCASKGLSVTVSGLCDVPFQPPKAPVSVVLEEILHGIIEAAEQGQFLELAVSEKQWSIEITITDHGSTLSTEARKAIDDEKPGNNVGGRVWGLALAKHVAWSIGAQLTVDAAPNEPGNMVTLRLPRLRP